MRRERGNATGGSFVRCRMAKWAISEPLRGDAHALPLRSARLTSVEPHFKAIGAMSLVPFP